MTSLPPTPNLDLLRPFEPYKGCKILVTGADGFIGSHLVESLLELGARVGILVRGSARLGCGSWMFRCIETPPERFEAVIAADIAGSDALSLIQEFRPEILFHLAAIAYVNYSFDKPAEVFRVNAVGALNVLEAARKIPSLERILVVSSSEVYGTSQGPSISESHPLNPTSPYAASKAAADRLAFAYRQTYGLPVVILRPFNTYGPRHTYDVIPKFIKLALAGKDLPVYGSGRQERDFTFVEDTVRGFLLAGVNPAAVGEVINLGSGRSIGIMELAEKIIALSGSSSRIRQMEARKAEVERLAADITKARRILDYDPVVSLSEGLRETIEWERGHIGSWKPED